MQNSLEQPLTKKERRELKRKEKEAARVSQERRRKVRKFLSWGAGIVLAVLAIWDLINFASNSNIANQEQTGSFLQIKEDDWVKGNPEAEVTLIEYSDFQCPTCGAYHPVISQLTQEFGDKVKFVYRHFPLRQFHVNAELAAQAAEAAGRQGKFWEMHDLIFENQRDWSNNRTAREIFITYAENLNLDIEQFRRDLDSKEIKQKVEGNYQSGIRLGVNSIPTFFLNGKKIQNPRSYKEFKNLIQQATLQQ